jgi:signal transduction histidine kinase
MGHDPEGTLTVPFGYPLRREVCLDAVMTQAIRAVRLVRPRRVAIAGVCAGLADHLGWRISRVRLAAVLLSLCGGAGIALYLWLWVLTPLDITKPGEPTEVRRATPVAAVLLGLAVAAMLETTSVDTTSLVNVGIPATIALCSAAVAWAVLVDGRDPGRAERGPIVVRAASAAVLLLTGFVLLFSSDGRPRATTAIGAVVMIAVGVGVLVAPFVLRLWRERMSERAARVRETQRAEIAAHLHDSVLQTLALIQNRAGASTEVARLARAQERELRDWLFAGTTPAGNDLAAEVREAAATIELDYPVRIDVVVVGEATGPNAAVLAATREAMVNAARHVGGAVSVYLENSAATIDVFIRDRGPGFDVDALPADRLGVRESIVGRMSRSGGWATVGRGVGGIGTEIHLHLGETAPRD